MQRAYKFRLYPSPEQEAKLLAWERQLRWLYNLAHEQRLSSLARWRAPRDKGQCPSCGAALPKKMPHDEAKPPRVEHTTACAWVDYFRQAREMTEMLAIDPRLAEVACSARQEVLRDLDKAWQRWRKGLGGRPRFKRRTDAARLYFSTPKHWKVEGTTLRLSGGLAGSIGAIRLEKDRPFPGEALHNGLSKARKAKLAKRACRSQPKFSSCHLVRDVDEWYAVFPVEYEVAETPAAADAVVGINRGAIHALADSDGRVVDSPRYYGRSLERVQLLSRRLSRKLEAAKARKAVPHWTDSLVRSLTGSTPRARGKNVEKARLALARHHQRIRRQRAHFLHDQSAYYTRRYGLIGIEDFKTREMVSAPSAEERSRWSNTCKRDGCDGKVVKRRLCQKHFDEVRRLPRRAVHRSILDVGWYELARQLRYKSEPHGGEVRTVNPGLFDAEQPAGISRTCSSCGAPLEQAASGHAEAKCLSCGVIELGDTNAAKNVRARVQRAGPPPAPKAPRASIKIKGRRKADPETTAKPAVDASGGDPLVEGPDERGRGAREGPHPERTVLPKRRRRTRDGPPTHAPEETTD